jgi:methionyl-tRNA formyltransferase
VRTVYLGTSAFAAAVLERLADSPHRPQLVVSRPDSRRGRGRHLQPPPVIETARARGLETFQPASVNSDEARGAIAAAEPDAVCVCAFGALIKEPLLSEYRILNVHPSLLPRWRGAAPIERAIMAGDERTGVSIMILTAGLDSGPVCRQSELEIGPEDDYGSVAERLQERSGEDLVAVLDQDPEPVPQSEDGVTYAEKITPEDRHLQPEHESATALARRIRALTPHVGAYLELPDGAGRLGVSRARVSDLAGPGFARTRPGGPPVGATWPPQAPLAGKIDLTGPRLLVGCAQGVLEPLTVQPPGRRQMSAEDFLRGLRR